MSYSMTVSSLLHGEQMKIPRVYLADTPWLRLRGLLGRDKLSAEEGLLISPCNSVHTMFIGYPIDLVYLDHNSRVVKQVPNLAPWRFSACASATSVLELPAGTLAVIKLNQGDQLSWQS